MKPFPKIRRIRLKPRDLQAWQSAGVTRRQLRDMLAHHKAGDRITKLTLAKINRGRTSEFRIGPDLYVFIHTFRNRATITLSTNDDYIKPLLDRIFGVA